VVSRISEAPNIKKTKAGTKIERFEKSRANFPLAFLATGANVNTKVKKKIRSAFYYITTTPITKHILHLLAAQYNFSCH